MAIIKEDLPAKIAKLRELVSLISTSSETVIAEWEQELRGEYKRDTIEGVSLPSGPAYEAGQVLLSASTILEELICNPHFKLITFATQYWASRALHIAAEHRIADVLDTAGAGGMDVAEVEKEINIDKRKLCRSSGDLVSLLDGRR